MISWTEQYLPGESVEVKRYRRHQFTAPYQRAGVELLAAVVDAHDVPRRPGHTEESA